MAVSRTEDEYGRRENNFTMWKRTERKIREKKEKFSKESPKNLNDTTKTKTKWRDGNLTSVEEAKNPFALK